MLATLRLRSTSTCQVCTRGYQACGRRTTFASVRFNSRRVTRCRFDPWDIDPVLMPPYFEFADEDDSHPHVVVEDVMVPMRDGVRLASTVYRPSFGGGIPVPEPLPVVFHRTPYNKDKSARTERCLLPDGTLSEPIENPQTADRFARRGYVVVIQDCRGRYQSEGRFTKYVHEGSDGMDSLEWIISQPWCNGKVGTFGLSYCAHVQLAMACKSPPGLAAMFLESGGFWDAYQDGVRYGGAFTMKQVTWAFKNAKVSPEVSSQPHIRAAMEAMNLREWFTRVHEWFPGHSPLSLAPDYESYIFHDWEAQYDGEEWQQVGLCARRFLAQMADVPTLIICSWYDPYVGSMSNLFNGLRAAKHSEVRMVLGPWTHGDHALTYAGEVDFGPQCTFDRNVAPTFQAARAAWFDEFIHGRPPGGSPTPLASPLTGGSPLSGTSPPPERVTPPQLGRCPDPALAPPTPPHHPGVSPSHIIESLNSLKHQLSQSSPSPSDTNNTPAPVGVTSPFASLSQQPLVHMVLPPVTVNGHTTPPGETPPATTNSTPTAIAVRAKVAASGTRQSHDSLLLDEPLRPRMSVSDQQRLAFFRPSMELTAAAVAAAAAAAAAGDQLEPAVTGRAANRQSQAGLPPKAPATQAPVVPHTNGSTSASQLPDADLCSVRGSSPTPSVLTGTSPVTQQDILNSLHLPGGFGRTSLEGSSPRTSATGCLPGAAGTTGGGRVRAGSVPTVKYVPSVTSSAPWRQPMPPVKYFRMGGGTGRRTSGGRLDHGGEWLCCTEWPPSWARQPTTYWLTPSGALEVQAAQCDGSRITEEVTEGHTSAESDSDVSDSTTAALSPQGLHTPGHRGVAATRRACDSPTMASEPASGGDAGDLARASGRRGAGVAGAQQGVDSGGRPVVALTHNPMAPVPTIGGNLTSGEPVMSGGAFDQVERVPFFGCDPTHTGRKLSEHPGVLSWATPALTSAMEVTGVVRATVTVTSDAPDADIHVTLVDEYPVSEDYPQGFAVNVASGICRARIRNGCLPSDVSWLEPGEPAQVTVELNMTSNLFAKGHRLRLDVSASSFPRYDINYGVTDEEYQAWQRAHGLLAGKRRSRAGHRAMPSAPSLSAFLDAANGSPVKMALGSPETDDMAQGDSAAQGAGYAPVLHAPLSPEAQRALQQRKAEAGLPLPEQVHGRPFRMATHWVHLGGLSFAELPMRTVDSDGNGEVTKAPASPAIPFSPVWLTRRPTWSR